MKTLFKVGDRVAFTDGTIGHIEEVDEIFCDVRWLTPNNVPSVLSSVCYTEHLIKVPDSVVPMRKNREWCNQSRDFCSMIQVVAQNLVTEV